MRVRIILDGSVVEVFLEDGPTFTERLYPQGQRSLLMRADDGARCEVVVRRLVPHFATSRPWG